MNNAPPLHSRSVDPSTKGQEYLTPPVHTIALNNMFAHNWRNPKEETQRILRETRAISRHGLLAVTSGIIPLTACGGDRILSFLFSAI